MTRTLTIINSALLFAAVGMVIVPSFGDAAANLIPNAGFETPHPSDSSRPDGWIRGNWGTNTATFSYPVTSGNGSRAARVTLTSRASGDAKWAHTHVPVVPGRTYEYHDSYNANVESVVTVEYRKSDGSFAYEDISTLAASSGWTSATFRFTPPAGVQSARVFHLINKVGTLTIDDVSLVEIGGGGGTPPDPSNLVPNHSLENSGGDGNPQSWAKGRWGSNAAAFTYPVTGFDGARGAKVVLSSYSSGDAKWYFNHVSVSPGDTYEFSNFYKSNVTTYVTVQMRTSGGAVSYHDLKSASPAGGWTQFKDTFTVPAGVTSLTVFHVIKNVGELSVDKFSLKKVGSMPPVGGGKVSINFDDGWLSSFENAIPILNNAGFTADQFIISERLSENFPGYVNEEQVLQMQAQGHIIGAHTRTHPALTSLSSSQAQSEIAGSRSDLHSIGASPVESFAYPFGAYNSQVQQMVKDAGFIAGRSSDGGYNDAQTDIYALRRQSMQNNTTLAQVKNYIDTAVANDTWVILLFHRVDTSGTTYAVTPALFQQIVDYLKQKNIQPITVKEGVQFLETL